MNVITSLPLIASLMVLPVHAEERPLECGTKGARSEIRPELAQLEVLSIAAVAASAKGIDRSQYDAPRVCFDSKLREWTVFYDWHNTGEVKVLDAEFWVRISDVNRKWKLFQGGG